jgi:hypothetical protein
MKHHNIVMKGAQARMSGLRYESNPYLDISNFPAGTSVSIREWLDRAMSWKIGWDMANAVPKASPVCDLP